MRIGIFGGTFDPVHLGHLILAERCRDEAGLDEVRFVPSARPPHKDHGAVSPFDRRAEMLRLAVAGHPSFAVDPIEKDRPGPSYTADTLEELARRHPDAGLSLILGADCLPDLPGWHEPARIVAAAELLFVGRPGFELWPAERLAAELRVPTGAVRLRRVESPMIDISSTEIRRRVASGKSVRYLVPRPVEEYLRERKLYATEATSKS